MLDKTHSNAAPFCCWEELEAGGGWTGGAVVEAPLEDMMADVKCADAINVGSGLRRSIQLCLDVPPEVE